MKKSAQNILTTMTLMSALAAAVTVAPAQNAPPATAQSTINPPATMPELAPITLTLKDASVVQVAAALKDASAVEFHRIIDSGQAPPETSFTLAAKDKSLWEVYILLARQGPLDLQLDAGGFGLLTRSGGPAIRVPRAAGEPGEGGSAAQVVVAYEQAAGPLLIRAGTKNLPAPESEPDHQAAAMPDDRAHPVLTIAAIVDPRLTVTPGELRIAELIDELGNKLPVDRVQKAPFGERRAADHPVPREDGRINNWVWQAALTLPDGHGKTIASAEGEVITRIVTATESLVVDDVVKHRNQPLTIAGRTFTVKAFDLLEGVINVRVEGDPSPPATLPAGAMEPGLPVTVTVLDATNKEGWSATGIDTVAGHFTMFQMRQPLKLRITVATQAKEVAIPFELKNLPLP